MNGHLLVEIGSPGQVGHRRIDAAAKILKNHGGGFFLSGAS